MNDFFDSFDEEMSSKPVQHGAGNGAGRSGSASYAEEIFSKKIRTRSRTYFLDLKQSMYGKFVKISEKSQGRKNVIMVDWENIPEFISTLEDMLAGKTGNFVTTTEDALPQAENPAE